MSDEKFSTTAVHKTREEQSGTRSLVFSRWIRDFLPSSSTGFCVYNQDWVFWNWKTKKLMLCEEKMYMSTIATGFGRLINEVIEPALKEFCPKKGIDFKGYFLIQFENTGPDDGKIFFDSLEITKAELIKVLSLE